MDYFSKLKYCDRSSLTIYKEINFQSWNENHYQYDYKNIDILITEYGTNGSQEWDHNAYWLLYFKPIGNDQWTETISTDWNNVTQLIEYLLNDMARIAWHGTEWIVWH